MKIADDFIGQRVRRIEKVEEFKKLGINPYPAHSIKENNNIEITSNFEKFENKKVVLSGRLVSWRDHGKLIFANLQDQSGKIQLWLKTDDLQGDIPKGFLDWDHLYLIDVGDFVEAHGTVTKTIRGEISLLVTHIRMLSKSIRLLPTKLAHKEQMFRRRYLDLTINPDRKDLFLRKSKFWEVQREYMVKEGFIEMEVPVLEHVTGGADARPFVTLHNELNQEFYMRISTELYQKRLIGGGFEKIFTIGPNFRNEGLSDEHLQEYYQIEWYWAYADYRNTMDLVKNLFRHIAKEVYGKTTFTTRGHTFDLADEWEEIDYAQTIKEHHNIDIFTDSDEKMAKTLKKAGIELTGVVNRNRLIDNLWKVIRKTLSGPAFLVNEPKFMSPLAKAKPEDERLTERLHVVLGGSELGNGYSEINDPQDQLDRFLDQQKMRNQGDDEAQMLDIDYVEMLEYGMPPTSGYAHSERLFWFLEDVTAREGTLFPQLKHEIEPLTKEIYEETLKPYNIKLEKEAIQIGTFGKSKETKVAHAVILKDESKPVWTRYNTVAHLTAALGSREGMALTYNPESVTKDGEHIPMNIQHAIMIKETDNKTNLLKLKRAAEEKGLMVTVFTEEMLSTTNDNKVKELQESKTADEIGYLGVLVFGKKDTVEELTKNFNLLTENGHSKQLPKQDTVIHISKNKNTMITRDQAFEIVNSNIQNKNLVKHCIAVEGAMEQLAIHFGESPEAWGMAGLLHDADWEVTADDISQHTLKTVSWIEAAGDVDHAIKRAVLAHNYITNPEPAPETKMEWSLVCCDELTGLITATALILPTKKLADVKVSSVLKRFKNKSFAAGVDRQHIGQCEEKLGIPLEQFTEIVIKGMMRKTELLGL